MDFELIPSEDGYIVIKAHGGTTAARSVERTRAAWEMGQRLGIRCFLVDLTESRNVEPLIKNVHFAKDDVPQLVPRGLRWAILVDPTDHSHDFQVAFAISQGTDMSLFWDRDEAIAYLLEAAPRINSDPTRSEPGDQPPTEDRQPSN